MGIITMQGIKIYVASCCRDRQPRQIFAFVKNENYYVLCPLLFLMLYTRGLLIVLVLF